MATLFCSVEQLKNKLGAFQLNDALTNVTDAYLVSYIQESTLRLQQDIQGAYDLRVYIDKPLDDIPQALQVLCAYSASLYFLLSQKVSNYDTDTDSYFDHLRQGYVDLYNSLMTGSMFDPITEKFLNSNHQSFSVEFPPNPQMEAILNGHC